ncbi:hypothetical protein OS493_005172 [Desmophyllum pertusum]|uniref:Endoglucanase n=1 Tax=Desmophyllum pertusum TaxID=174260 RepID=A0A9X0CTC6_9CNID|nr:hypothetical protein OS493_005172 [Desmophyllum pertusum]
MFERGAPPTMQPPTAGRSSPRSTTQRPSSSPSPSYTPSTNRFSSTRRPKPTKRPRSTRRPKPTKRPRSTRRPKPTKRPSSTRRPKPTKRPSSTRRPKPTKRPSSTRRPKPTKRPKSTPPPKPTTAGKYNYNEVLKLSILFYEAQRSGKLPRNNRVKWRKDSALKDKGVDGEDLTGGWYDAGDYVKFGFPMASSVTVLAWGLVEYKQAYVAAEFEKYERFPIKVGDGDLDHDYWGRPEDMTMNRPAFKICPKKPGSDLAAETAAALAAASIAFKGRKGYAKNLLLHAKQLYEFADNHRGVYSDSIPNAAKFYKSWSGYKDELVWEQLGCTEQRRNLLILQRPSDLLAAWAFSWDDKRAGVQLLLAQLTKKESYEADIKKSLDAWLPGGTVKYTPKGLAWRIKWGSNRYAANTAFLALVAADHGITPAAYRDFATKQIHYMLGDTGRSFVVGFGKTPPQRPHHRSSSCPSAPERCDKSNIDDPEPMHTF